MENAKLVESNAEIEVGSKMPRRKKKSHFLVNLIKVESRKAMGVIEKIISPLAPKALKKMNEKLLRKKLKELYNKYYKIKNIGC